MACIGQSFTGLSSGHWTVQDTYPVDVHPLKSSRHPVDYQWVPANIRDVAVKNVEVVSLSVINSGKIMENMENIIFAFIDHHLHIQSILTFLSLFTGSSQNALSTSEALVFLYVFKSRCMEKQNKAKQKDKSL
jgi:hypothetical protein